MKSKMLSAPAQHTHTHISIYNGILYILVSGIMLKKRKKLMEMKCGCSFHFNIKIVMLPTDVTTDCMQ